MAEVQTIPARHGVATFVPAGQTIKIINSSGTQVVDMWAFALPAPEAKNEKSSNGESEKKAPPKPKPAPSKAKTKSNQNGAEELPSQEDAEKATSQAMKQGDEEQGQQQKSSWSSYVPSLGWSSGDKDKKETKDESGSDETEQQKNSKTWSTYFPSGKGFSNYIPKSATDTVSAFAASHRRDPNKSYVQQLQDFSKTPVGAAGWNGLAAVTGSGYSGSMYAGYQAWSMQAGASGATEFLSMAHTRTATNHMRPKIDDVLVSNIREPMLTLVEDTSSGDHDTLIAACDPQRYKGLGVEKWDEHGSCAENLVLALQEINDRAGLTATKAVGAGITVYSAPAPLNLFMKVVSKANGDLAIQAASNDADDFVRFRAERDVVVVLSACPMDVSWASSITPTESHFLVEHEESVRDKLKRAPARKTAPPKKTPAASQQKTSAASSTPKSVSTPVKQTSAPVKQTSAPAKPAAAARTAPKQQTATAAPQQQPARKKPIPPPVNPQKKQSAPDSESKPQSQPAAKKKPRKLNQKPAA